MTWMDDINGIDARWEARKRAIHNGVCEEAFHSIVEGSQVTGAPGQPVDTGNLKASWVDIVESEWERFIVTNVLYAPIIEDGTRAGRALTLRSQVGGFHSVKLTVAGWQSIVTKVVNDVT